MEAFMKLLIPAAVLVLLALPAGADVLQPISPHQALANKGECVSVEGTASVRSDPQRPGFDLDLDGKDSSAFGYILPQNKAQFPDLDSLNGRHVTITGVVQFYLGRAEITMTTARQLNPVGSGEAGGLTQIGPEFAKGNQSTICG
jgi:hypothetical protein